jgi:integrase
VANGEDGLGSTMKPASPRPPELCVTSSWDQVDLEIGALRVAKQFTHGAWADLKTINSRRGIPVAKELVKALKVHRLRTKGVLVFPGPSGAPIDYHNWRTRVWLPLLASTGPDEDNPNRVAIEGTFHMLRHFFVTALIQSGVNAKVAQTLAGHHSAAFTVDQYADAVPQQLEEAGEKVATVLLDASGSILVAAPKRPALISVQVVDSESAPEGIRTPDHLVRRPVFQAT